MDISTLHSILRNLVGRTPDKNNIYALKKWVAAPTIPNARAALSLIEGLLNGVMHTEPYEEEGACFQYWNGLPPLELLLRDALIGVVALQGSDPRVASALVPNAAEHSARVFINALSSISSCYPEHPPATPAPLTTKKPRK